MIGVVAIGAFVAILFGVGGTGDPSATRTRRERKRREAFEAYARKRSKGSKPGMARADAGIARLTPDDDEYFIDVDVELDD